MDIQALVSAVRENPEMMEAVSQISQEFEQEGISPEMLHVIGQAISGVLEAPETYPQVRAQAIEQGLVDEDDLPEQFDPQYLVAILLALNEVSQHLSEAPRYAKGGLARMGRGGDTMLAHINSAEAEALKRMGGSGTINPATGIHEFKGGFFKKVFKVIKSVAPIALAAFGGPALAGALGGGLMGSIGSGALIGGLGSAVSGGNILKGALMGGLGGGLGSAFGGAASGGSGISGGISMPDSFGAWGETAAQGLKAAPSAVGSALSGGMETLGATGGGLAAPGLGMGMEGLGGLGTGVSGALPSLEEAGQSFLPTIPDDLKQMASTANTAMKLGKTGLSIYNSLNPPEPEQFSQQNTQHQMQQMGGLGMNTNRAFGLGGTQSRGMGMMSRFRNGGLARCTCGGK